MEIRGQLYTPTALTLGIGGWRYPRACLDAVEKTELSYSCRESNPESSAVQLSRLQKKKCFI
jgi:hypothetical protein